MRKWVQGTKGGKYLKKMLGNILFDAHILKLQEGGSIRWHTDNNEPNKSTYRINFLLKKAESGGKFLCPLQMIDFWRINIYRPDIEPHCITEVQRGETVILSIGVTWLK